jgi:hypothetical protein
MRKPMAVIFLLTLMLTIAAATSSAGTITIAPADVYYKVNESGVNSYSSAPFTGEYASSTLGHSFHLFAGGHGTTYTDAGIILFFGGGLRLGDLESLTVNSSYPLSIALWLDTSGDGSFIGAAGGSIPTTYSGSDSMMGNAYNFNGTLNSSSSLNMYYYPGKKSSASFTLAQLQQGGIPGFNLIGPDTRVAIWIGIDNYGGDHSAIINSIEVTTVPEPGLLIMLGIGFGAAGLVSWRWKR